LKNLDDTEVVSHYLNEERGVSMPQGATETSTLKVGDQAPDFTLEAHGNRRVTLSEYRGLKNVFVCFYPLDWTPV
jgi:peroxiredoxin